MLPTISMFCPSKLNQIPWTRVPYTDVVLTSFTPRRPAKNKRVVSKLARRGDNRCDRRGAGLTDPLDVGDVLRKVEVAKQLNLDVVQAGSGERGEDVAVRRPIEIRVLGG